MPEITVGLEGRSYPIFIERKSLGSLSRFLAKDLERASVLLVTDDIVGRIYGESVLAELAKISASASLFQFPAGEESKNLETLGRICGAAVRAGLDRRSAIVALGGGVAGDLAGFAAATYMRGIAYVQIPTSLLAMVDSSVGGKTAVDLPEGKNLVGAFWQPRAVLADPEVLSTLPGREIACGLAEVVKYGVAMDSAFFDFLEQNSAKIASLDMDILQYIISRCCELKARIVSGDEREESGLRAILNLGHSFGHAIESATGFAAFRHGEAVSIGMVLAAKFAARKGLFDKGQIGRMADLLRKFSLPTEAPRIGAEKIVSAMASDKKNVGGKTRLVLPERIGEVSVVPSERDEILEFLREND